MNVCMNARIYVYILFLTWCLLYVIDFFVIFAIVYSLWFIFVHIFSKHDCLVTFTEETLNRKFHFLYIDPSHISLHLFQGVVGIEVVGMVA